MVEANWQNKQSNGADLYTFKGKIDKSKLVSWSIYKLQWFTKDALEAFKRIGPTNIICIDAQDLYFILDEKISLIDAIKQKARKAVETGGI